VITNREQGMMLQEMVVACTVSANSETSAM